jgi:hypothetical protein
MDTASFLNDLFEVYSTKRLGPPGRGQGRSLKAMPVFKGGGDSGRFTEFDKESCEIVGIVRTGQAHPSWMASLRSAKKRADKRGGLNAVFRNVAASLDRTFGTTQDWPVKKLLEKLLGN